ncbi:MAG: peptide chain release factor N(5)-glutamine methyltransferase [Planctomycetaceae bacterium]
MSKPATPAAAGEWTVRRVLEWTIGHLKERGCDSPRLDAEVLLAFAWNVPRIQLYVRYDQPLPDAVRSTMRELVKRRANLEPVAYLIGRREFFSLEFEVQPGVFIPRPATETLVMEGLRLLEGANSPRILDLCTGTGCIAVTLAKHVLSAQATAVDLNPLAIETARKNAARHEVESRVDVRHGDLFVPLELGQRFDLIVSNPPYIRDDELAGLSPDVRNHEPQLALTSGADGLDVVRRIVANAADWIASGGSLLLEIDPAQAAPTIELLRGINLFEQVDSLRDLDRNERIVRGLQARR